VNEGFLLLISWEYPPQISSENPNGESLNKKIPENFLTSGMN